MNARALLLLGLVVACGDAAAIGGDIGGVRVASGAAADPTPVFRPGYGAHGSGPSQITAPVFGSTTMALEVDCDARTAVGANFPCATGGTFVEENGDVDVDKYAPFTETAARAADYDRVRAHKAPNTTLGEMAAGTDFIVVTAFSTVTRAAAQYVVGKYDSTNSQGWAIRATAGDVFQGVINATTFGSTALNPATEWSVAILMCDAGGVNGARLYINGFLSGSAANCPNGAPTTTAAKNLTLGARSNSTGTDGIDGMISFTKVYTCTGCMTTTADMDAVALKMSAQAMGVWPSAAVTYAPTAMARTTAASFCSVRDNDNVKKCFLVGPRWARLARLKQESPGGRYVTGYLAESVVTNLALQSFNVGTTWTELTAADTQTLDLVVAPNQVLEADAWNATAGADLEHGGRQAITLEASSTYQFSMFHDYLGAGGDEKEILWLRDQTVANAIAYFDVERCAVLSMGAGLHSFSAAATKELQGARADHLGVHSGHTWCRFSMFVDGTAASHNFDFGWADTVGDTSFAAGGTIRLGVVWQADVVKMDASTGLGSVASSYIPTTTATKQRSYDELSYHINNFPAQGMLAWSAMVPRTGLENGISNANGGHFICTPQKDGNNYVKAAMTASHGSGVRAGVNTTGAGLFFGIMNGGTEQWDCCGNSPVGSWYAPRGYNTNDGNVHSLRVRYINNDFAAFLDGDATAGATDSSGTVPTLDTGSIDIGFEQTSKNNAGGLIEDCLIFDEDFEITYPWAAIE